MILVGLVLAIGGDLIMFSPARIESGSTRLDNEQDVLACTHKIYL